MSGYLLNIRSSARCQKNLHPPASRVRKPTNRDIEVRRTERERFEMSFGSKLNRAVVPADVIELCFDAWKCGRRTALTDGLDLLPKPLEEDE